MDRDQARSRAQTLLDSWKANVDKHDAPLNALAAEDAAAIDLAGSLEGPDVGLFLSEIAERAPTKLLQKAARRGLHRLRAAGREVPSPTHTGAPSPVLAAVRTSLAQVSVSSPDTVGTRMLWLFVERSSGGGFTFGLVLNEIVGLKGCTVTETTRRHFRERLADIQRTIDLPWVDVSVDYGRALLAEAVELNAKSGFTLPADYLTYGHLMGDLGEPPAQALVYEAIPASTVRLDPAYLAESALVLDEPELLSWVLDFHEMRTYTSELEQSQVSQIVLNESSQRERQERIIKRIIRELIPDAVRHGFKRRLEELAFVFLKTGRELAARRAVAAAIALEQPLITETLIIRVGQSASGAHHPLIDRLVVRSLDVTMEIERSGLASSIPNHSPFDPIE